MKIKLLTLLLLSLFTVTSFAEEGIAWDSLSAEEQTVLKNLREE